MLPVTSVRPAELRSLRIRDVFTPFFGGDSRFVAGIVADAPVVVMIEGEYAFEADPPEKWDSPSGWAGWAIQDVRFEVDAKSASSMPARRGMLILSETGAVFVMAKVSQGVKAVRLDSSEPSVVQENDVAFSNWRIVCGSEDRPVELFKKTGTPAVV